MTNDSFSRRGFLARAGVVAGGTIAISRGGAPKAQAADPAGGQIQDASPLPAPAPSSTGVTTPFAPPGMTLPYRPVVVPNGMTLPWKMVDGVKVFHLVAEPVVHEFSPGLVGNCWGYNGRVHGPTIEAVEGDRVRIYVTNRLSEPTTVHWHGVLVPSGMDGVAGVNQKAIRP